MKQTLTKCIGIYRVSVAEDELHRYNSGDRKHNKKCALYVFTRFLESSRTMPLPLFIFQTSHTCQTCNCSSCWIYTFRSRIRILKWAYMNNSRHIYSNEQHTQMHTHSKLWCINKIHVYLCSIFIVSFTANINDAIGADSIISPMYNCCVKYGGLSLRSNMWMIAELVADMEAIFVARTVKL